MSHVDVDVVWTHNTRWLRWRRLLRHRIARSNVSTLSVISTGPRSRSSATKRHQKSRLMWHLLDFRAIDLTSNNWHLSVPLCFIINMVLPQSIHTSMWVIYVCVCYSFPLDLFRVYISDFVPCALLLFVPRCYSGFFL
jgi:hypothetical protein